MYRTALAVSHTLDIDQLLNRIMQLIFEWVEADRGCIMLLDEQSKTLEPKVRRNRQGVETAERLAISKTILDYVTATQRGRADQRRPRGRPLGPGRPASCRWAFARRFACRCRAATTWWA